MVAGACKQAGRINWRSGPTAKDMDLVEWFGRTCDAFPQRQPALEVPNL